MRKIQIERKLFRLLGHKFLVFENFKDSDLNIDDESIYKYDNQNELINIFWNNKFYSIWEDERRHNATIICACYGNINNVKSLLKKMGISPAAYATFDCNMGGEERVLYLKLRKSINVFFDYLASSNTAQNQFFGANILPLRKNEISQLNKAN